MDQFRMAGGIPLQGCVKAAGSKNAALPILAATLLTEGITKLERIPELVDTRFMGQLLTQLGMVISQESGVWNLHVSEDSCTHADYDLVRQMRGSICVLGPLLARRGEARISLPGGCVIGHRPVDLHLKGMEALGATVSVSHGEIRAVAPRGGLRGARLSLSGPHGSTVLGTANVLMAACLAQGETQIEGAAQEPEITSLVRFLQRCGAIIEGVETSTLHVQGVSNLQAKSYVIPPDRIEVGTLLLAAAMTRGQVIVEQCYPPDLQALLNAMRSAGVSLQVSADSIQVNPSGNPYQGICLETAPHPGFPTDLQAQWLAFATTCHGRTQVKEGIYPDRFLHVAELNRLGAAISVENSTATLQGPCHLSGAPVMASDLRASAALVLAGLCADGETLVNRVYHLDRGYESLETKLSSLGARVVRAKINRA
ncbi:MAG: UDP-N-acetylglucosamine 1-carboxyvinyltransferase [Planctomycetota bacterium]|nr:UDP-N-acetylglucosamine 1-carboxyvinyltransferase [Planctomycetota bacterium]